MSDLSKFARKLKKSRKSRKLSQEKTAEFLNISTRWYQKIEYGSSAPGFRLVCDIIKLFGIGIWDFDD